MFCVFRHASCKLQVAWEANATNTSLHLILATAPDFNLRVYKRHCTTGWMNQALHADKPVFGLATLIINQ